MKSGSAPDHSPLIPSPTSAVPPFPFTGEVPREIGRFGRRKDGPTLVCLGGCHGNELMGVIAIREVLDQLHQHAPAFAGQFIGLTGNRQALSRRVRYVDQDLNRIWTEQNVNKTPTDDIAETKELRELIHCFEAIRREAAGPIAMLDLHTFSAEGLPFAVADESPQSRQLGDILPVPTVLGATKYVSGTLLEYVTRQGIPMVAVEGGMHQDPTTKDTLSLAIWETLHDHGHLQSDAFRPVVRALREQVRRDFGGFVAQIITNCHEFRPFSKPQKKRINTNEIFHDSESPRIITNLFLLGPCLFTVGGISGGDFAVKKSGNPPSPTDKIFAVGPTTSLRTQMQMRTVNSDMRSGVPGGGKGQRHVCLQHAVVVTEMHWKSEEPPPIRKIRNRPEPPQEITASFRIHGGGGIFPFRNYPRRNCPPPSLCILLQRTTSKSHIGELAPMALCDIHVAGCGEHLPGLRDDRIPRTDQAVRGGRHGQKLHSGFHPGQGDARSSADACLS